MIGLKNQARKVFSMEYEKMLDSSLFCSRKKAWGKNSASHSSLFCSRKKAWGKNSRARKAI